MKQTIIKFSIIIRLILPILFFTYLHPFFAMLATEVISDGIFGAHHYGLFENGKKEHMYDKPLDMWALMISLIFMFKSLRDRSLCEYTSAGGIFSCGVSSRDTSKGGSPSGDKMFDKYIYLMITLFLWRLIGFLIFYLNKNINTKIFVIFPNLYIGAFYGITLAHLLKSKYTNQFIYIGMALAFCREVIIHYMMVKD